LSTIGTIAETLAIDPRELLDFYSTTISVEGDKLVAELETKPSNAKNKLD
jgi:hypothetical protein